MIIHLLILIAFFIVFTFLGYAFHRIFHQPWSGRFYKSHMNHHLKQYPLNDFYSDKYRNSGKDNSVWLFAIAFSPLVAILVWSVVSGHVGILFGAMIAIEMAIVGWLNDSMHDSFHIRKTFWHKFPFFQRLIDLHYQHHVDMGTNYGIFSFYWDKVFKTFKE